MTKNECIKYIAAIISTLSEFPKGTQESNIYLMFNCNIKDYETIKNVLLKDGLISINNNWITLTNKGLELGKEINVLLKQD